MPAIVIASREDQFALPKECQALANAIASQGTEVEHVIIENSGHSTLAEQPAMIIKLFDDFAKV